MRKTITLAVEGAMDVAIAQRLVTIAGHDSGAVYTSSGKSNLDRNLPRYNKASAHGAWLVLRDLDEDAVCAMELVRSLLPDRNRMMLLRIPVRSVESWLLADRVSLSKLLQISIANVGLAPDALDNPKWEMLRLARLSRSRTIREALLPIEAASVKIGPGYTSVLMEFSRTAWNPGSARINSPSLDRCLRALEDLQ